MFDNNLYWEDYDGQDVKDFTMIGVAGENPAPIINLEQQVAEFMRTRGNVLIRVYKPEQGVALGV